MTDDIPFDIMLKKPRKKKGKSIFIIADDEAPYQKPEAIGSLVPHELNPEEGEEILVISDDSPFQS